MAVSKIGTKYVLKDSLGNMQFEFEGGKNSILSYEDAESIAFDAIHGSNKADAVVLGKMVMAVQRHIQVLQKILESSNYKTGINVPCDIQYVIYSI